MTSYIYLIVVVHIIFVAKAQLIVGDNKDDEFYYGIFPKTFKFGVASSAYQYEGAWDKDKKGESIWDHWTHENSSRIADGSNADVAADFYHKYKEDIQLLKKLGADTFRFSISWPRILPKGTTQEINHAGIEFYNAVINETIANGLTPFVTLYHWNLPNALQETDGWKNEDIIQSFTDYARICFKHFGDRVKLWTTINEPWIFCMLGYTDALFPPGISEASTGPYKCVHTMIKTHALVYQVYKEEFVEKQKGQVGIVLDYWWHQPKNPKLQEDIDAAERANEFQFGWIATPFLLTGNYPNIMREMIDKKSQQEQRNESRLPLFTKEWQERIKGSLDFLGVNHYTSKLVSNAPPKNLTNISNSTPNWKSDCEIELSYDPMWNSTGSDWLKVYPAGFRKALNWIKTKYNNPHVIIGGNGVSDRNLDGTNLNDTQRTQYFTLYINELLKAIKIDGCNVSGYNAWTLLDCFEWSMGYQERFGLYYVNYSSPNLTRIPKESTKAITKIFTQRGFPSHYSHQTNGSNYQPGSLTIITIFSMSSLVIVYIAYRGSYESLIVYRAV